MPESRMVLMTDSEKEAMDHTANYLRRVANIDPQQRSDYYNMANVFQEIVDRIWDYGFTLNLDELIFEEEVDG